MDDDAEVSRFRAAIVWASTSKVFGWVGPSVIATVAFLLRLWRLEQPRRFVFDETYYAKDAFSLWHGGYPRAFIPDADVMIGSGVAPPGILQDKVSMIMHPGVGKGMMTAGVGAPMDSMLMTGVFGGLFGASLGALVAWLLGHYYNGLLHKQIKAGRMTLWVRTPGEEEQTIATDIMRRHGGRRVHVHQVH